MLGQKWYSTGSEKVWVWALSELFVPDVSAFPSSLAAWGCTMQLHTYRMCRYSCCSCRVNYCNVVHPGSFVGTESWQRLTDVKPTFVSPLASQGFQIFSLLFIPTAVVSGEWKAAFFANGKSALFNPSSHTHTKWDLLSCSAGGWLSDSHE